MYAIVKLDPSMALEFRRLAPFEVRHLLEDLASFHRMHAVGATLLGRPVGLGLAIRGWASESELSGAAPKANSARVLALTVARTHRRIGIGRAMLESLEESLGAEGVESLAANFPLPPDDGAAAIDGLLRAAGWNPRELTMLQCRADHALLSAPIMQEQATLPQEYEIVDWVDLSDEDREHIRERQRVEPWYPPTLDPFHFEPELEILNSLALRYHGEIVGWLITRRTSPITMYYRSLFVREDLSKLGRGFALIYEAICRQAELVGALPGYGEWSTPASLPLMCRFIRRRLAPYGTAVTEQFVARKSVNAVGDTPALASRVQLRVASNTPLLTSEECDSVVDAVNTLREQWTERFETIPFATLGAMARLDSFDGADVYLRAAAAGNPLLVERFGWLYKRLALSLESVLGGHVEHRGGWAVPVFRILSAVRGAHLPVAPIHCDTEHRVLHPGAVYSSRPVSFAVTVSRDGSGAGLNIWELASDETIGLDTEEIARLLEEAPVQTHELRRGELLVHSAHAFHQTTPRSSRETGPDRITLEGHAIFEGGIWRVYG